MSFPRPRNIKDAVLITHKDCMDGAACCILFTAVGGLPENVHLIPAGTVSRFLSERKDIVESGRFMIFADLGLDSNEDADMLEKRGDVVVLDHHKTALFLKGRTWCDVRQDRCGSRLLMEYLIDHDLFTWGELHAAAWSDFVHTVDDHDRWVLKRPQSEEFALIFSMVGQQRFIEMFREPRSRWMSGQRNSELTGRSFRWSEIDETLLSIAKERLERDVIETEQRMVVKEITWGGRDTKVAYVISGVPNTSEILDPILTKHPDIDVACQINLSRRSVSLRSRNGYDVSEMAKYFGGGGHRAAAGHPLKGYLLTNLIEDMHNNA